MHAGNKTWKLTYISAIAKIPFPVQMYNQPHVIKSVRVLTLHSVHFEAHYYQRLIQNFVSFVTQTSSFFDHKTAENITPLNFDLHFGIELNWNRTFWVFIIVNCKNVSPSHTVPIWLFWKRSCNEHIPDFFQVGYSKSLSYNPNFLVLIQHNHKTFGTQDYPYVQLIKIVMIFFGVALSRTVSRNLSGSINKAVDSPCGVSYQIKQLKQLKQYNDIISSVKLQQKLHYSENCACGLVSRPCGPHLGVLCKTTVIFLSFYSLCLITIPKIWFISSESKQIVMFPFSGSL